MEDNGKLPPLTPSGGVTVPVTPPSSQQNDHPELQPPPPTTTPASLAVTVAQMTAPKETPAGAAAMATTIGTAPTANRLGGPGDLTPLHQSQVKAVSSSNMATPRLPPLAAVANIKYISLSTPLAVPNHGLGGDRWPVPPAPPAASGLGPNDEGKQRPNTSVRLPLTRHVLHNLPARATLHREKQITGRFFPKATYTESQRSQLERLRPVPKARLSKRFTAPPVVGRPGGYASGTSVVGLSGGRAEGSFLVHTPSGVRQKTNVEKSSWVASRIFGRGTTMASSSVVSTSQQMSEGSTKDGMQAAFPLPSGHDVGFGLDGDDQSMARHRSIPPAKTFYLGSSSGSKNPSSGYVTGQPKTIHQRADLGYPPATHQPQPVG